MGLYACKHFCLIWTFVLHAYLSLESGTMATDPCPDFNDDTPVVNICPTTTSSEEQDSNKIVLRVVNTTSNCECYLDFMNASSNTEFRTTFTRLGPPNQGQNNCGIQISMMRNNATTGKDIKFSGWFFCNTSYDRPLRITLKQQERIRFQSEPTLEPDPVGYCLQVKTETTVGAMSKLRIVCTTRNVTSRPTRNREINTVYETKGSTVTRRAGVKTTLMRSTETLDKKWQRTQESGITQSLLNTTFTDSTFIVIHTSEETEIYPLALGITAAVLCVFLIVTIVVVVRRRCRKSHSELHMESRTLQSCPNGAEDDYGLKYNVLYVSSDRQPDDTSPNVYETVD